MWNDKHHRDKKKSNTKASIQPSMKHKQHCTETMKPQRDNLPMMKKRGVERTERTKCLWQLRYNYAHNSTAEETSGFSGQHVMPRLRAQYCVCVRQPAKHLTHAPQATRHRGAVTTESIVEAVLIYSDVKKVHILGDRHRKEALLRVSKHCTVHHVTLTPGQLSPTKGLQRKHNIPRTQPHNPQPHNTPCPHQGKGCSTKIGSLSHPF